MGEKLCELKKNRVLVVGTTSDYIEWIRNVRPGQALFLTEPKVRQNATEPCPENGEEILCPICDIDAAIQALNHHKKTFGITLSGIACFDCESMEITSILAKKMGLSYPDLGAVRHSRDKFISKQLWRQCQIPCPETCPVNTEIEVLNFLDQLPAGIVLKPFCGSGSELVFKCVTRKECDTAFNAVADGLAARTGNPLFKPTDAGTFRMLAEEWVAGPEFSCDFLMEEDRAVILRKTRKIKVDSRPFGTISGYAICPENNDDAKTPSNEILSDLFYRAARALGIETGVCMVDFILRNRKPVLIEMTPRPGGDCLPFLLKEAGNIDIIGLTLDAAAGVAWKNEKKGPYAPLVAFRIHARKNGVLKRVNTAAVEKDDRVKKIHLIHAPGHRVTLPPQDYDSWLLGHMIIEPHRRRFFETECLLLAKRIDIEMDYACSQPIHR
ncbi:ATP-grasp domain-containing protein [Desulfobacter vibrioformis]|uniref:ATP-grasp domain-containing protein n=1 Tax=Desulfobacter vibrioformis TaxID=34031 RepID=UPI000555EA27|nr:ATP-grasp domain-containing protein [Desulfobacter vibrioformis]